MIHIGIQERTQRSNFNINPSAACLLCYEVLHGIIQIFIDGSSAGTLLAAFAFFHVSVEPFFLPSFALKTSPVPCPSASSSGRSSCEKLPSGSAVAFSGLVTKEQGCTSLPCASSGVQDLAGHSRERVPLEFLRQGSSCMTPCMQKVSYDYATREAMVRRALTQRLGLAVPSWGIAFKKASLHCKKKGFFFFSYQASFKVP